MNKRIEQKDRGAVSYFVTQSEHLIRSADIPVRREVPVWLRVTVWLSAFCSPTVYLLLLLLADRFGVPSPPEVLVAALFYLIPPVALLVCGTVVWWSSRTVARRIGWLLFTLFAMLLQVGALLAIIIMATAAIG